MSAAELPLTVQSVRVSCRADCPGRRRSSAELPLIVQSVRYVVPSLYRPPPDCRSPDAAGDGQARDRRRDAGVDLEDPAHAAAADGHARRRAGDRLRPARVAQLELALRQRDRLGRGEDGRVEGDRLGPVQDIGQVDRLAQVSSPRANRCRRSVVLTTSRCLGLEGADVDRAESSGNPRWSWRSRGDAGVVGRCPCRWPGCRAGAPWSGSARRSRPAGPGRPAREAGQDVLSSSPFVSPPSRRCRSGYSVPVTVPLRSSSGAAGGVRIARDDRVGQSPCRLCTGRRRRLRPCFR